MRLPLVNIVTPSYKPAHFEQCLRSAIGQTYANLDITVSDTCPTEKIRALCAKYPQVIYQRNTALRDQNLLGAFFSAKGDLIKPLFDDDLLYPSCVDKQRTETRHPRQVSGSIDGLAAVAAYFNLAQDDAVCYIDEELSYWRHDQRLASNSNATANPNFGYCFSDDINLTVQAQRAGATTADELAALHDTVDGAASRLSSVFPMVGASRQRYLDHIAALI